MSDILNPVAVKTKADGDVVIDFGLYDGTVVGATNGVHVRPGTGAVFTIDSELPAAVALTDNFANPTAPGVGAFAMVWDGATWDRAPGTAVDGQLVNLGANNDVTVTSGSITADTELPAAAALTDNFANPTAPGVGAFGMLWDGATWDRMKGDSTDGLLVNLGANNDVTFSGSVDTELPAAAALADNTATPTAPAVGAFGMVWDGANWDRAPGTSFDGALVNLGTNNDVTVTSGSITADTELPAAAALADNTANPTVPGVGAFLMGWDATNWDRISAVAGRLQVDVISGGGVSTPTTPVTDPKTSAALAAGASVDVDSTDVGAATKKLRQVLVTSSVPFKAVVKKVADAVATTVAVLFGRGLEVVAWQPPHQNYVTQAPAGAGFDGFRVSFTNMDNVDPADVYATFLTEE